MPEIIGSPITGLVNFNLNTQMPSINEVADIQEALRLYHYGAPSGDGTGVTYNPYQTNGANLKTNSIAGALYSLQTQITNISGTQGVQASVWNAKGTLVSASGPSSVSALGIGLPGQVLTVNNPISATTTGLVWSTPEVTLINTATLENKTLTSPIINTPLLTLSTVASTTDARMYWDTTNKILYVGNGTTSLKITPDSVAGTLSLKTLSAPTITQGYITDTLTFEGSTNDAFETTLGVIDPTADRAINLPNAAGTVITTGNLTDITSVGTVTSGSFPAANISGTTLASNVVSSSLTSVGTLNSLAVTNNIVYHITTNAQSASYSLVLADDGKFVEINNASANTVTVPLNSSQAFPIGSQVNLLQTGTGQTSVVPTAITTATYSSGGAASATTFVISATNASILAGQLVTGAGFAPNTYVTNVSTTTITVSPAILSQVSGTITFSIPVFATPGLKLRSQWSSATLVKRVADSRTSTNYPNDTWILIGDLSL